jgi:hypothetical protein
MSRTYGRRGRIHPRRKGQALVEFALVLPVLMILLLMAIDLGRLYFGWVVTQNMARIAANYAANDPAGPWGAGSTYQAQINADAATINCTPPALWPAPSFIDGGTQIGDRVQVNLTCGFRVLTPLVSGIVGNPVQLGASSVFPIKAGLIGGVPVATAVPTPSPSPSPSASAGPSPSASPGPCTVPPFLTLKANSAPGAWKTAGFVPSNLTVGLGTGNYKINTETPAGSDGTLQNCSTFVISVGP